MRDELLRAARSRLRNPVWAEDAVSETLLAALERPPEFREPARVRAWVYGILRHKLVDQMRCQLDQPPAAGDTPVQPADLPADERSNPLSRLIDRQFIAALAAQLDRLPPLHARAFVMRECWGSPAGDICDTLKISSNHLWVVLHRTRGRLRTALADHDG